MDTTTAPPDHVGSHKAIYTVYVLTHWRAPPDVTDTLSFTSPHHAPMPNHLPTLIVTPHGVFIR